MSKIIEATCDATGKVTAEGVIVPGATVLSEGKQTSSGLLVIDGEMKKYIPSSAADIKTTIEKTVATIDSLTSVLNTISGTLTAIGAGMTGPTTAPPGTLATDVATIASKVAELNATKAQLNTLKGALK